MTSITGISSTTIVAANNTRRQELPLARAPKASNGRALVALQPAPTGETPVRTHADARFLTHLIATDQKVPQTRERRRAEPLDATTAYAAASAGPAAPMGVRLLRVM